MIIDKEKNFVSAVVYLGNDPSLVKPFLTMLSKELHDHFEHYEIIGVNDACAAAAEEVKSFCEASAPLTLVNMSVSQGVEACMNAGIDIAIGDYIFEFDSPLMPYDPSLIYECYKKGQEGYDIVSAYPKTSGKLSSNLFYRLFNSNSRSKYEIGTDSFHVLSRRAINRLHAINPSIPYRKAAYAASGLKIANVAYVPNGKYSLHRDFKADQAVNALALYTSAAYKLGLVISAAMLALTIFSVVYAVVIYSTGKPVEGWTTTMLLLSVCFFGVFTLLTFVVKYLSLLVDLVFRNQHYLIESVEKIQSNK